MRASELLTALTLPSQDQELRQIQISVAGSLRPCSRVDYQAEQLILVADSSRPPLSMTKLVTLLMTHRRYQLFYSDGKHTAAVYGFKEEKNNLIL